MEVEDSMLAAVLLRRMQEREQEQIDGRGARSGDFGQSREPVAVAAAAKTMRTGKATQAAPATVGRRRVREEASEGEKGAYESAALRRKLAQAEVELESLRDSRSEMLAASSREHEHAAAEMEALREELIRARAAENEARKHMLVLAEDNKKLAVEVDVYVEKLDACAERLAASERRQQDAAEAVGEGKLAIADLEQRLREATLENKVLLTQKDDLVRRSRSHDTSMSDAVYTMEDKLAAITVSSQQQQQQALKQMDEYKRGLLIAERNKRTLVDKVVDALDAIARCLDGAIASHGGGKRVPTKVTARADTKASGAATAEKRGGRRQQHAATIGTGAADGGPGSGAGAGLSRGAKVFFSSNVPAVLLAKFNSVVDKVNALAAVYVSATNDVHGLRNELQLIRRQRQEESHEHEVRAKLQSAEHAKATASLRAADEAVKEKKQTIVGLHNDVDVFKRHATLANENNLVYQHCVATACDALQRTLAAATSIEYFPKRPVGTPVAHVDVGAGESGADARTADLVAGNAFDVDNLCSCLSDFVRLVDVSMKDRHKASAKQEERIALDEHEKREQRRELTERATEIAKLREEVETLTAATAEGERKLGEEQETHSAALAIIKGEVERERQLCMEKEREREDEHAAQAKRQEHVIETLLNGFVFLSRHLVATTTTTVANVNNAHKRRVGRLLDAKELLTALLLEQSGRCHTLAGLLEESLLQGGVSESGAGTGKASTYTRPSRFRIAVCAVIAARKLARLLAEPTRRGHCGDAVLTVHVPNSDGGEPIPFSVWWGGADAFSRAATTETSVSAAEPSTAESAALGETIFSICGKAHTWMATSDAGALADAASGAIELFDLLSAGGKSPLPSSLPRQSKKTAASAARTTPYGARLRAGDASRSRSVGLYSSSLLVGVKVGPSAPRVSGRLPSRFDTFVEAARTSLNEMDALLTSAASAANQHRRDLSHERHTVVALSADVDRLRNELARAESDGQRMQRELRDSVPLERARELEEVVAKLRRTTHEKESQLEAARERLRELQEASDGARAANEGLKQQIVNYQQQQVFFKTEVGNELQRSTKLQQKLDEAKAKVTSLESSYNEVEAGLRESRAIQRKAEDARASAIEEMSLVKRQLDKQASIGIAQVSAIQEAVQIAKRAEEEVTKSRRQQQLQQQTIERMRSENTKQKHRSLLLREELYSSRHALDDIQSQLRLTEAGVDVDMGFGGVAIAAPALPPSPAAAAKGSYIEMAKAELAAIRGAAKSKLGLIEGGS